MKFDNNFKQKVAYAIQDGLSMSRRVVRDEDDEYSNYKNFLKPDKVYNSFSGLFKADPSYQVFPLFRGSYKLPLILEEERGILFSVLSKSKYDSLFSRKSEEKIHLIDALTKYNNGYLQKNKQLSFLEESNVDAQKGECDKIIKEVKEKLDGKEPEEYIMLVYDTHGYELLEIRAILVSEYLEIIDEENWSDFIREDYEPQEIIDEENNFGDKELIISSKSDQAALKKEVSIKNKEHIEKTKND